MLVDSYIVVGCPIGRKSCSVTLALLEPLKIEQLPLYKLRPPNKARLYIIHKRGKLHLGP